MDDILNTPPTIKNQLGNHLLPIAIVASVALHLIVLQQFQPHHSYVERSTSTPLNINLRPVNSITPPSKPQASIQPKAKAEQTKPARQSEQKVLTEPAPQHRPSAAMLFRNSEQFIQNENKPTWNEKPTLGDSQASTIDPRMIDQRLLDPVQAQRMNQQVNITPTYNGRWRVEVPSAFGGVQCFEVAEENALQSFSEKAWLLREC